MTLVRAATCDRCGRTQNADGSPLHWIHIDPPTGTHQHGIDGEITCSLDFCPPCVRLLYAWLKEERLSAEPVEQW
jgi:hypothetical protein